MLRWFLLMTLTVLPTGWVENAWGEGVSVERTWTIDKDYLIWPITRVTSPVQPKNRFFLHLEGELLAFIDVELATNSPDFWVFTDLTLYQGKILTVKGTLDPNCRSAWGSVRLSDHVPGMKNLYREPLRPQFHFSSKRGWHNDSDGLLYYQGQWHLFYQHNPYNWHWWNMHWGHAVSDDLLHWQELPSALFASPDLKTWEKTDVFRIEGTGECPDMFALPVDGDPTQTKWVIWGSNGTYQIGDFDGRDFVPETASQCAYHGAAYGGQTFDNSPDGRRIHIGWVRDWKGGFEGMPFNQQMTLPLELSLCTVPKGNPRARTVCMAIAPVQEVEQLRLRTQSWQNLTVEPGTNPLADITDELTEVEAVFDTSAVAKGEFCFTVWGRYPASYDMASQKFYGMKTTIKPEDERLKVRLFVDRTSLEVFVNGHYTVRTIRPQEGKPVLELFTKAGTLGVASLRVHKLKSIWENDK